MVLRGTHGLIVNLISSFFTDMVLKLMVSTGRVMSVSDFRTQGRVDSPTSQGKGPRGGSPTSVRWGL